MTSQDRRAAEEIALLPCPFCGDEGQIIRAVGETWVLCKSCKASGTACSSHEAGIAAWNRRALVKKAREEERERCAKIADDETECEDGEIYIARLIARRIRIPSPPESEG